ncbi:integrase catalytic domain-containing protein [Shewanella psychrotolerans]|uniref:integrase catalytic domain-containing protein n=1 Tax=Shewanella psychrotolerans TaxID=2864206 RepID=UPI001C65A1C4|nr:transposase family protein [Shewanella psychrotolerans]QYJ99760.1 transposase family protein [Shewanella psychrotolerans]
MIPQAVSFSGRYLNEAGVMLTPIFADEEMTILAKEDNQGQREYIKTSLFAQKLLNGDIQEVLPQRVAPVMTKQQEIAFKRKLAYVKTLHEIVNALGKDLAPTTQAAFEELKSRLLATQPELVYDCMPGRTTICSYWHTWVTNGYDDNSLMPKKRKQSIRLDPISEEYLEERIFKDFCNGQHHNLTACYRAYKSDVDGEDNEIKAVSLSTYRRRVLNMSEFEHRLKDPNLHPSERSKIFSTLCKKIKLNYAGERIEVDRMSPNLCLIDDETGLPTEKVDIYIAFDAYSRVPVGVTLEFGQGENKESVTRLIQSIYESDNYLPTSIKPHELVADNGSGFNNSIFHKLGEGLGVTVTYNPAYSPMMKPFVESFNNTMRNGKPLVS